MNYKHFILNLFFAFVFFTSFGQKHTVSGFVTSYETGERLAFTTIYDTVNSSGTVSNTEGFFSITLPNGLVSLNTSYLGYQSKNNTFSLKRDTTISITLKEKPFVTGTVDVSASKPVHEQVLMGLTNLPVKTIEAIPSFTGQPDLMKAITFIPGFSGGKDGYSNIMVRGGDSGQNLILLDGIKLYNTSHFGGFVSLFNTDVVKQVDMYKGGFPARYGGRLASVINVMTHDGNKKKIKGKFSLGLISSSLALDGPIGDKITFLLSARTSYFDLILLPTNIEAKKNKKGNYWSYFFYDLNGKITYQYSQKSKWAIHYYRGNDKVETIDYINEGFTTLSEYNYRMNTLNSALSLKNDLILSSKIFMKNNVTISGYANDFIEGKTSSGTRYNNKLEKGLNSNIREISAQSRLEFYASDKHTFMGGVEYSNYTFTPMVQYSSVVNDNTGFESDTTIGYTEPLIANEFSFYIEDDIRLNKLLYLNLGLRCTDYFNENVNYLKFDPRISIRAMLNEHLSVKANYTLMHQFNHVIINNVSGMEREFWLSSSEDIPPQEASQWSAGIFGSIPGANLEMSAELYYKTMSNLLEFRFPPEETVNMKPFSETVIKNGIGEAYGGEFQIKYNTEKFRVDLGYTLSRNNRQFDSLNNGNPYPFIYERRHQLSLFTQLKLGKKYLLNAHFQFATGTPVTFPDAYVRSDEYAYWYYVYSGINNRRLPDYHRLDLSFIRRSKTKKGRTVQWSLNIFNAYARENPVFIYYKPGTGKVYQKSLFSIIPSISYSLEF